MVPVLRGAFRRLYDDDRGSATMEILIWIPLLVELMLITVDVSTLYWRHGEMWTVARDAARQAAMGALDADDDGVTTEAEVVAFIRGEESADIPTGQTRLPASYVIEFADGGDSYTVTIHGSEDTMSLFGTMSDTIGDLRASVTMAAES